MDPVKMSREALIREVLASRSAAQAQPARSRAPAGAAAPPVMADGQGAPSGEGRDDAVKDSRSVINRLATRRKTSPEERLTQTQLMAEVAPKLRALKGFTDKILRDLKEKRPRDLLAIDERNRLLIELQALGTTLDAVGR
jgi:hypothetical protein